LPSTKRALEIVGDRVSKLGAVSLFKVRDKLGELPSNGAVQWILDGELIDGRTQLEITLKEIRTQIIAVRVTELGVSSSAWLDVTVLDSNLVEIGTDAPVEAWSFQRAESLDVKIEQDSTHKLFGDHCMKFSFDEYHGGPAFLKYPAKGNLSLSIKPGAKLVFWIDATTPASMGFQDFNPQIALLDEDGRELNFKPNTEILNLMPDRQNRSEWQRIEIDLTNPLGWKREGFDIQNIAQLTIRFDTWDHHPFRVWLDGLSLAMEEQ